MCETLCNKCPELKDKLPVDEKKPWVSLKIHFLHHSLCVSKHNCDVGRRELKKVDLRPCNSFSGQITSLVHVNGQLLSTEQLHELPNSRCDNSLEFCCLTPTNKPSVWLVLPLRRKLKIFPHLQCSVS